MAASRKLQMEIEKTIKAVDVGIAGVEEMWEVVEEAETHELRTKHESELKRAIKRLQRHRENLRTWAADSSVKQKQPLQDARRRIEEKMEAFRIMEHETKTKSYARAGTTLSGELDEEGLAQKAARDWLTEVLSRLAELVDETEADIELQQAKKKPNMEIVTNLESRLLDHKTHVEKVEQLMRLLDNRAVRHEEVTAIREDMQYYLEEHDDPDFIVDMDFYDAIPALAAAEAGAAAAAAGASASASAPAPEPAPAPAPAPAPVAKAVIKVKVGGAADASKAKGSRGKRGDASPAATAASAADAGPPPRHIGTSGGASLAAIVRASAAPAPPPAATATAAATLPRPVSAQSSGRPAAASAATAAPAAEARPAREGASASASASAAPSLPLTLERVEGAPVAGADGVVRAVAAAGGTLFGGAASADDPFGLGLSFDADEADLAAMRDPGATLEALGRSMQRVPETSDVERERAFVPRNPVPAACVHPAFLGPALPLLEDPAVFSRFKTDTLFFAFYFMQGTPQQTLAARQLLQRSWRLHTDYGAWFQRFAGDRSKTETSEVGPCKYFDFESTWSERVIDRFEFRYDALHATLQ